MANNQFAKIRMRHLMLAQKSLTERNNREILLRAVDRYACAALMGALYKGPPTFEPSRS